VTAVLSDGEIEVRGLRTYFPTGGNWPFGRRRLIRAVEDVSFTVRRGEIVGLVGESGSGKTTIGRSIVRLEQPVSGMVVVDGQDLLAADAKALKQARRHIQFVFQDPYSSLDPRMRVEQLIGEALAIHGIGSRQERQDRIGSTLRLVGLQPDAMRKFPHEFSGGQRQRIGIARALAVAPRFLIADEPISALDMSVQAQVLNLLADLRDDLGLGMLVIAHDLPAMEQLCDRIVVLYLGRIMEAAPAASFFASPLHPYSRALLAAAPSFAHQGRSPPPALRGEIPSPMDPPSGCVFRTRCPHSAQSCSERVPEPVEVSSGHRVACLRTELFH